MGKHQITAVMVGLMMAVFAVPAVAGEEAPTGRPLTFYGVEMKREDKITLNEAKKFARSHGQANYVLSKTPLVSYEGTGDVFLASYGLDRAEQEKAAAEIPGKGKILEIQVLPSAVSAKKDVGIYKLPIVRTEDSIGGDVWVRAGSNTPQMIAKAVLISSTRTDLTNLFRFIGFTDKEGALAYCLDQCVRYDLVNGTKTPLPPANKVDVAGIHTSVDELLTKQGDSVCKSKMNVDTIQNVDKNGYYRGLCTAKGNQVLEVQLKKSSGSWKVLKSTWEQPQTLR
ncbi:MAG TPA: hypothetical protein VFX30_06365 [bacterium]|nr:hypothetical protein [bacterium]